MLSVLSQRTAPAIRTKLQNAQQFHLDFLQKLSLSMTRGSQSQSHCHVPLIDRKMHLLLA
jgi:hypothetical protein